MKFTKIECQEQKKCLFNMVCVFWLQFVFEQNVSKTTTLIFHFTIRGSTGLTPPIQLSSLYLLFFLSPLLSIFLPHTHSILRVTLTPFHLWPWKSALRWPPYIGPLYYLHANIFWILRRFYYLLFFIIYIIKEWYWQFAIFMMSRLESHTSFQLGVLNIFVVLN